MPPQARFCARCGASLAARTIDGLDRLACTACDHVIWDNPVPVVAAIVDHEGAVILARNRDWPEKMFGLITGFVEREEVPEAAVLREVEEELGVRGRIAGFVGHYAFAEQNQLLIVYHVEAEGNLRLGAELAEIRRIPPRRLKPWDRGTGPALADWLAARSEA